jgi:5-methylcytosine-specific restriction endonuclease McrA
MTRKRGTNKGGRAFSPERVEQVWEKAKTVPGKNPDQYRRDPAGNMIRRASYGKESEMGWEIDHKKPVEKGGSDNLRNLQPLQTDDNREKSNKYPWKP